MSLYLKYRPKTIDELDLLKVRETLQRFVKANKLAHAYLFTGPRGAGKTSAARILARVVNCERNREQLGEPCNQCRSCREIMEGGALDVVEIDAASNRGVDDIRQLKEKIRLAPVSLPYKVYIIDEVHMLTTEAFNALLKTLEEPPSHSLFILCTTELHKVPETIVSRCVQVSFYKASVSELARSFARVLRGEGVAVDAAVLQVIAERVDGSFRDGVKILEQVLALGSEVTVEKVESILAAGSQAQVERWLAAMLKKDTKTSLLILNEVVEQGVDLVAFLVAAMQKLRAALLSKYEITTSTLDVSLEEGVKLVYLMDDTARKLGSAVLSRLLVEAMIIEWGGLTEVKESPDQDQEPSAKAQKTQIDEEVGQKSVKEESATLSQYQEQMMDEAQLLSLWRKMLAMVPKSQYSLEALLSKARPVRVEGKFLVIGVAYDFHKCQLETPRFRESIEKLILQAYGMPLLPSYEVMEQPLQRSSPSANMAEESGGDFILSAAKEIFL